ncbi:MAG: hypothetical protein QXW39_08225 [Candidatus Bathyarchaeia archaeon]
MSQLPTSCITLHTGIEVRGKEIKDVVELVGEKDPYIVSLIERSIASDIIGVRFLQNSL